jgi:hypothetical protein
MIITCNLQVEEHDAEILQYFLPSCLTPLNEKMKISAEGRSSGRYVRGAELLLITVCSLICKTGIPFNLQHC